MRQKSATQLSGVPRVSRSSSPGGAIVADVLFVKFSKATIAGVLNVMHLRHAKAAFLTSRVIFSKIDSSIPLFCDCFRFLYDFL